MCACVRACVFKRQCPCVVNVLFSTFTTTQDARTSPSQRTNDTSSTTTHSNTYTYTHTHALCLAWVAPKPCKEVHSPRLRWICKQCLIETAKCPLSVLPFVSFSRSSADLLRPFHFFLPRALSFALSSFSRLSFSYLSFSDLATLL